MLALSAVASTACSDSEPEYAVASGLYQLTTAQIAGDCKLDWALRPGPLAVGSVMPATVVTSAVSIDVRVCGHPDQDPSCVGLGDSYRFGMSRDGNELVGSQLWLVPGCGMAEYNATLTVAGNVSDENTLSLTWTAAITATDPAWSCDGYRPCSSMIDQRMALTEPL